MLDDFNCPNMGSVIKAGREVVGKSGMFITKKRYANQMFRHRRIST